MSVSQTRSAAGRYSQGTREFSDLTVGSDFTRGGLEHITASETVAAGAVSPSVPVTYASGACTLANGSVAGQTKLVYATANGTTVTPASALFTQVTYTVAGDGSQFIWDGTNWHAAGGAVA